MSNDFPTVDFSALGQQATEMINSAATPPESTTPAATTPPAPSGVVQPSATTPPSTPPSSQPPSTQPPVPGQQPPASTFQVDLGNGRVETLTAEQLRDAYLNGLRQQDYTRKTQEVAAQRAQIEAQAQQIQAVLNNPAHLMQLAQQYYAANQPPPPPPPPDAPVTYGQLQATLQAQQQGLMQVQQQAQQYVNDRLEVAKYAESINNTLSELYKQHPVLSINPETEDVLRYRVAQQLSPTSTLEDAQAAFKTVAAELAGKYDAFYTQRQQHAAAQQAQLAATGTEPPGGAAPQAIQKPTFVKDNKLDWNAMAAAALATVQGN